MIRGGRARKLRRILAVVAMATLVAWMAWWRPDASNGEDERRIVAETAPERTRHRDPREITEQVRRSLLEHVALDRLDLTPHHAVLRGHARDLGGVADLLRRLRQIRYPEQPGLRRASRSERGYEYTIVIPDVPPAAERVAPMMSGHDNLPPYAAPPVSGFLHRLLSPPFT